MEATPPFHGMQGGPPTMPFPSVLAMSLRVGAGAGGRMLPAVLELGPHMWYHCSRQGIWLLAGVPTP